MRFSRKRGSLLVGVCVLGLGAADGRAAGTADAPANAHVHVNATWDPALDWRFGVMTHFAQSWNPDWTGIVKEAGIPQVRDELYWKVVEAQKGVFSFPASYENYFAALKLRQISPLVILSFENPLYDGGNTPYTQAGFDGYARYGVEVLRHYGAQIRAVEIWNEYNGSFNHGPAAADRAATYVAMARTAYAAIKKERPDVTVVGGATAGVPLPYWEKIMAGGGLAYMDALSVHPYRYGSAPEGLEDDIAGLQRLVLQYNHGQPKPIWVSEIGWYLKPSLASGDLLIDEAVQARFLVRAYALLFSADVQHVFWYLLHDYQGMSMGLTLDDAARTHKADFFAMQTLIKQLAKTSFVQREKTADDLYSLLFQRSTGEELRILWSLAPRTLPLAGATGAVGIDGKPVALGAKFAVDDSPLFVSGPFRGLPPAPPPAAVIADARRDFAAVPTNGWSYGAFSGGKTAFIPLPTYALTDWKAEWTGTFPYISITAVDQHPSNAGGLPVTAVRRWTSNYTGSVRVTGSFLCTTSGDGVGVGFSVDGVPRFRTLLGGGAAVLRTFDLVETVRPGTTFDFTVDPGPAADINFDATAVTVVIHAAP